MLDLLNLPNGVVGDTQIFVPVERTGTTGWQIWNKPRGATMAMIIAIGAGGGGGGGQTGGSGASRGGGGGGASSGYTRIVTTMLWLPEKLHIQVPVGGAGGAAGSAGTAGFVSYVSTSGRSASAVDCLLTSSTGTASGGSAGSAGNGGAGGLVGTAESNTVGCRITSTINGQVGAAGGAFNFDGNNITIGGAAAGNGKICSGGAGGAGVSVVDRAGGGFNAVAGSYLSSIRPPAAAAGPNKGADGFTIWKPFYSFGGCGGSASNLVTGGAGGKGGYGAGGGGGGGGSTGGRGGDGGDGIVIIVSW